MTQARDGLARLAQWRRADIRALQTTGPCRWPGYVDAAVKAFNKAAFVRGWDNERVQTIVDASHSEQETTLVAGRRPSVLPREIHEAVGKDAPAAPVDADRTDAIRVRSFG